MTVKEYAVEMNVSVAEVLKKCQELGIDVTDATDELLDDDIVMLDNTINLISTDDEVTYEEEDEIDDVVEDIMESSNISKQINTIDKKQKLKKQKDKTNAELTFGDGKIHIKV